MSANPDALTPAETLKKTIALGEQKVKQPFAQTLILAIMAGLFIGMGGMFMLLVKADSTLSFFVSQISSGMVFLLGLFLVITAGGELFTGSCLMVCGKLSKKYAWLQMLKTWAIVYLGNFIGSLLLVAILYFCDFGSMGGGAVGDAMITVAAGKVSQSWQLLLFKGVMCNLLVCIAVWVAYASRTIVDKFVAIILPISAFVACGFEHCVANMFFLPMGLLLKSSGFTYDGSANISSLDLSGILYNLPLVTLGNIIGGSVLVGLMYWLAYRKSIIDN